MPHHEPLKSKLLRYFFFGWMLETPDGDLFLRTAQRRDNRLLLRRWLPHYARVHAVMTAICGALVALFLQTGDGGSTAFLLAALGCAAEGAVTAFLLTLLASLMLVEATTGLDRE